MLEATQHLIGSLDDMPGYVAFVGHAHIAHGVAAYKAIAAHEAEHAAQQLIAARAVVRVQQDDFVGFARDRKSTRLNSSHLVISYAVFCLKKKKNIRTDVALTQRLHSTWTD